MLTCSPSAHLYPSTRSPAINSPTAAAPALAPAVTLVCDYRSDAADASLNGLPIGVTRAAHTNLDSYIGQGPSGTENWLFSSLEYILGQADIPQTITASQGVISLLNDYMFLKGWPAACVPSHTLSRSPVLHPPRASYSFKTFFELLPAIPMSSIMNSDAPDISTTTDTNLTSTFVAMFDHA
ncbi:hypothetical protein EDB85DRAFT_2148379 [Lactarius pseudohatsudake]|nr:hypothetical protein EDB85DRAFT_2148379 [Lactarius pseudohatsudake]